VVASFFGPAGAAVIGGTAVLCVVAAFSLNPNMRRAPDPVEDSELVTA
jgi:hypothetical protein